MFETISRHELADIGLGLGKILVGVESDRLDRAETVDPVAGGSRLVEWHEHVSQCVHVRFRKLTTLEDLGSEQVSVEFAHDDDPVDHVPLPVKGHSIAVHGDGYGLDIDRRSQPPVELHLGAAVLLTKLDGREVEETEVDRFFELVGTVPGQKNRGNVGLQKPDLLDRVVVEGRFREGFHKSGVIQSGLQMLTKAHVVTSTDRGQHGHS